MAKTKDVLSMMEGFKETDIRKLMLEYLDGRLEMRKTILCWLTGEIGKDFDTHYSYHDMLRSEVRFIELVMKKIPDEIIQEEKQKQLQKEAEELSNTQAQIDDLAEMVGV